MQRISVGRSMKRKDSSMSGNVGTASREPWKALTDAVRRSRRQAAISLRVLETNLLRKVLESEAKAVNSVAGSCGLEIEIARRSRAFQSCDLFLGAFAD
jgi:hypothetical protein